MWSFRKGIKTVQIEELLPFDPQSSPPKPISNRYVHAKWDPETSAFEHLDGAIRTYDPDQYVDRLATDLKNYSGKATNYTKAFLLNGEITLQNWCLLVSKFFVNNELVLEYLGGPEPNQ